MGKQSKKPRNKEGKRDMAGMTCGMGNGTLKEYDLERFYNLVPTTDNSSVKRSPLMDHLQLRLQKVFGGSSGDVDRYTNLVKDIKALRRTRSSWN